MEQINDKIVQSQIDQCSLLKKQLVNALELNMFTVKSFAAPKAIRGSYAYHLTFASTVPLNCTQNLMQYFIQNYGGIIHSPTLIVKEPPLEIFFFMDYDLFDVAKAPHQTLTITYPEVYDTFNNL